MPTLAEILAEPEKTTTGTDLASIVAGEREPAEPIGDPVVNRQAVADGHLTGTSPATAMDGIQVIDDFEKQDPLFAESRKIGAVAVDNYLATLSPTERNAIEGSEHLDSDFPDFPGLEADQGPFTPRDAGVTPTLGGRPEGTIPTRLKELGLTREFFANIPEMVKETFKQQAGGIALSAGEQATQSISWRDRLGKLAEAAAGPLAGVKDAGDILPGPVRVAKEIGDWASDAIAQGFGVDSALVEGGQQLRDEALNRIAQLQPAEKTFMQEVITSGTQSAALALPGMAVSMITRNPTALLAAFGASTYGDSYGTARDAGKSPEEAHRFAMVDAGIEVGTEIGPAKIMLGASKTAIRQTLTRLFKSEMGGETLATIGQKVNSAMAGVDTMPIDQWMGELWEELKVTWATTAILTPLQGATAKLAGKAVDRLTGTDITGELETITPEETAAINEKANRAGKALKATVFTAAGVAETDLDLSDEQIQKFIDNPELSDISETDLDAIIGDEANEEALISSLVDRESGVEPVATPDIEVPAAGEQLDTQLSAAATVEEEQAIYDRRNEKLREIAVKDMTPAEKDQALLLNDLTHVPNRRKYAEDMREDPHDVQISVDLDGLKWANDTGGHQVGDMILGRMAKDAEFVVKGQDARNYHFSGDEFPMTARDTETAIDIITALQIRQEKSKISWKDKNNYEIELGITFGFGTDNEGNFGDADKRLIQAKEEAKALGQKSDRGEVPRSIRVRDSEGRNLSYEESVTYFEKERLKREKEAKSGKRLRDPIAEAVRNRLNPPTAIGADTAQTALDSFNPDQIESVPLREAIDSGLISEDEGAVIDGFLESLPESLRENFDVVFSGQEFEPTEEQLKAHDLEGAKGQVVRGALLERIKNEARDTIVMFGGSDVTTFFHEFGELSYKRLLTSDERKYVANLKTQAGSKAAPNEWFSDQLQSFMVQEKEEVFTPKLQKILSRIAETIKKIWEKIRISHRTPALDEIFRDILSGQRGIVAGETLEPVDTESKEFKEWFGESKMATYSGDPLVLYHQTSEESHRGIKERGFDLGKVESRKGETQLPDGVFMKPSDKDIGLAVSGEVAQIPLYASITNPLRVDNRDSMEKWLRNDKTYSDIADQIAKADKDFGKKFDDAFNLDILAITLKKEAASRDEIFEESQRLTDAILEEWRVEINTLAAAARARITEFIKGLGYDGVIVEKDVGSMGRSTKTIIAFEPTQVKSAVSNTGAFDPNDPRITASVGERSTKTAIREVTGQVKEDEPLVRESVALKAAFTKAAQAARAAERAGDKQGVAKEKARMKAILESAKERKQAQESRTKALDQIKKELKTTKVKKQSGKPKGKFTADIQEIFNTLRADLKLNKVDAFNKIAQNLEDYKDSIPPFSIAIENRLLSVIAAQGDGIGRLEFARIQQQGIENLLTEIKGLKGVGKSAREAQVSDKVTEITDAREKVIDLVGGIPEGIEAVGEEGVTLKGLAGIKQGIRNALIAGRTNSVVGWKDLLDIISFHDKTSKPGESAISKFGDVLEANNAEKQGNINAMSAFRGITFETYGLDSDSDMVKKFTQDAIIHDLGEFKTLNDVFIKLRMTRAEIRKRAMEIMDPTLHDTIFTPEGMGWTQEMSDAVFDFLTPQDEDFIAKQLEFYQQYYESINEVYEVIYGVNLPKNINYSPIAREGISQDAESTLGEFFNEISLRASADTAGGIKSRVATKLPLRPQSDISVIQQHVAEMEHFKAWSEKIRDLNAVFGDSDVRQAIRVNFGDKIDGEIQRFIIDMARGGTETSTRIATLDRMMGKYARSVLALKPSIFLKQLTSTIAYADSVPAAYWTKEVLKVHEIPKAVDMFFNEKTGSTLIKSRWDKGDIERDISNAMKSSEFARVRAKPSFLNAMMFNVKLGDMGAIIVGGYPVYKYHRSQGLSHEEALKRFESVTESTQQSADISQQSSWQRGGSFAKLFTMFMSSPNQYLRKEIGAIRNLAAGRMNATQFAKTMMIYHVILPMFFQLASDRFVWSGDEDEDALIPQISGEQKRAMILGSLNGFFIVGDALEAVISKALDLKVFGFENPMWSIVNDAMKAWPLLDWDDIDPEDFIIALRALAGATGAVTGLPLKQAVDFVSGFNETLSGEYETGIAQMMGWSPHQAQVAAERGEE